MYRFYLHFQFANSLRKQLLMQETFWKSSSLVRINQNLEMIMKKLGYC